MRIIWYKPHQPPELYQPRYFPVAFARDEDTIYLPTLDLVQSIEEALDQLFQDDQISVDEFQEVLQALYEHRLPGEPLRETTVYKTPVVPAQFEQVEGLRPFNVWLKSSNCSVLVRDIRWLRSVDESGEETRRLGVWLWVAGYVDADVVEVDVENTYLAEKSGKVLSRLTERPQIFRREVDALVSDFEPNRPPDAQDVHFATTLILEEPPERKAARHASPDLLHIKLAAWRVRKDVLEWDFGAEEPTYPLIKSAGLTVVLVEGLQRGTLDAEGERRFLDDRNQIGEDDPAPYYPEHPVLLVAARTPAPGQADEARIVEWRSPVELLMQCPLSARLQARDGELITPESVTIQVQSNQPEELVATYHFCARHELPPLQGLAVEVLTVEPAN